MQKDEEKITGLDENSFKLETKNVSPWGIMQKLLSLPIGKPDMDAQSSNLAENSGKSVVPKYTGRIPEIRDQFIVYLPAAWLACARGTTKRIPFLMDTGAEVNVINHRLVPMEFTTTLQEAKKSDGCQCKSFGWRRP